MRRALDLSTHPLQAVSREADHLAITALTRALHVPLRIAYLDQSSMPYGGGGGQETGEVNFVEFEEEAMKEGERGVEGALLYRAYSFSSLALMFSS